MLHVFVGAVLIGLLVVTFAIARELLASRPEAMHRFGRVSAFGASVRDGFGKLASLLPAKEEEPESAPDDSLAAERAAARMERIRARSAG